MIRHIVLVRPKAEASEDDIAEWKAAASAMCATSPEVLSHSFGDNIGTGPNHYDTALVADFADWEAFRAYIASDAHQAYVRDHASKVVGTLAAIQHEL